MRPAESPVDFCKQLLVEAHAPFANAPSEEIMVEEATFSPLPDFTEHFLFVVRHEEKLHEIEAVRDPRTNQFVRATCAARN